MPLIVTVNHDCWMSSDRLQHSGRQNKFKKKICIRSACIRNQSASYDVAFHLHRHVLYLPSPYRSVETNVLCILSASWCQITCFLTTFIVSRKCAFLVCQLFTCESCPPLALTYFTSTVAQDISVCSGLNAVTCTTLAGLVSSPEGAAVTRRGHRNSGLNSLQ
jgi:hypothetical protein